MLMKINNCFEDWMLSLDMAYRAPAEVMTYAMGEGKELKWAASLWGRVTKTLSVY